MKTFPQLAFTLLAFLLPLALHSAFSADSSLPLASTVQCSLGHHPGSPLHVCHILLRKYHPSSMLSLPQLCQCRQICAYNLLFQPLYSSANRYFPLRYCTYSAKAVYSRLNIAPNTLLLISPFLIFAKTSQTMTQDIPFNFSTKFIYLSLLPN